VSPDKKIVVAREAKDPCRDAHECFKATGAAGAAETSTTFRKHVVAGWRPSPFLDSSCITSLVGDVSTSLDKLGQFSDNRGRFDGAANQDDQKKLYISWIFWSHPSDSNRRPADYESAALPTELGWPRERKSGYESTILGDKNPSGRRSRT
jgi:hypothetical protein